jgi:hypothetical protein
MAALVFGSVPPTAEELFLTRARSGGEFSALSDSALFDEFDADHLWIPVAAPA